MRRALRPGGRLAAQNGGAGNIDALSGAAEEVAAREPYAVHFEDFEQPWNYAEPEETEARLRAAGFAEVRCWLQPWEVVPPEPAEFLRPSASAPTSTALPEELRERFVADVLATKTSRWSDYVRLNIEARAPSALCRPEREHPDLISAPRAKLMTLTTPPA